MPKLVPACQRTIRTLEVFAAKLEPLSLTEVSRSLGIRPSSCMDLLYTLEMCGCLFRMQNKKRYFLTGKLPQLLQRIASVDPLSLQVEQALTTMRDTTGETVIYGSRKELVALLVLVCDGSQGLRYVVKAGETRPLHSTALGKALLGQLGNDQVRKLMKKAGLPKITPKTLTSVAALVADLEKSRKRGWYSVCEESTPGLSALAVSGTMGNEPFAVSIVGPTGRVAQNQQRYLDALVDARRLILNGDKSAF